MSLIKRIERNLENSQSFQSLDGGFFTPNQRQIELTQKYILPNVTEILHDSRNLRRKVDRIICKSLIGGKDVTRIYPKGYCLDITQHFLRQLSSEMLDRNMMGFQQIKHFVQAGGAIKRVWGIDNNKTFQNVIQIGSAVLDVARDTGGYRPPNPADAVQLYLSIDENPTQDIQGFEDLSEIMEKYWGYEIYPNTLIPYFAPIFPIIALNKKGNIQFIRMTRESHHVGWKNFCTPFEGKACGLAWKFITTGKYSHKKLPETLVDRLQYALRRSKLNQRLSHVFDLDSNLSTLEEYYHQNFTVSSEDDIYPLAKRCQKISELHRYFGLDKMYYTKV